MKSGILLPVFSLPSEYGIGSFGKEAYEFIDFLQESGVRIWQMLPLNPTSYGDSPYQSPSAFAGNPYFISPELLKEDGLLSSEDLNNAVKNTERIDYGALFNERYALLEKAYASFRKSNPSDFESFCKDEKLWLEDYALFMALKKRNGYKPYFDWPSDEKMHRNPEKLALENSEETGFWKFLQYEFSKQYMRLKKYAHEKGIGILGDMPIYVALDSADTWANGKEFCLDEDGKPTDVAGVPPDYFSENGQLWGNPLYNWNGMKENGYTWWKRRLKQAFRLYDYVRIDHFRAFYNYYAIPYGSDTAKNGEWRMGPGIGFFNEIKVYFGETPIVAEDLGDLSPGVYDLLEKVGFPGMKVLQFAFDGDDTNMYLPMNYLPNCIVYTGTHDNDTSAGWLGKISGWTKEHVGKLVPQITGESMCWSLIRYAHSSRADISIIPMQDYLELGSECRINEPSTTGNNWQWRMNKKYNKDELKHRIYQLLKESGRAI